MHRISPRVVLSLAQLSGERLRREVCRAGRRAVQLLHVISRLLLLLQPSTSGTGWRSDTQGVLAIRKPNTAALDQTVEGMAVKLVERLGGVPDVFKLIHSQ